MSSQSRDGSSTGYGIGTASAGGADQRAGRFGDMGAIFPGVAGAARAGADGRRPATQGGPRHRPPVGTIFASQTRQEKWVLTKKVVGSAYLFTARPLARQSGPPIISR